VRPRYDMRKDLAGWTVFDVWTGQPVVIGGRVQNCLEREAALELVTMLNDQARRGDRVVLQ
jgi:hypothetical protein